MPDTASLPYIERTLASRDGLTLYYRDYPAATPDTAGVPVLCLPGVTRNSADFARFAEKACAHRRVLCVDLRGRGKSGHDPNPMNYLPGTYVQDIVQFLDHAGVKRAVFFGTSLGGIVTMIAAQVIHRRLAGAILNDIGPVVDAKGLQRIMTFMGKETAFKNWDDVAKAVATINTGVYPDFTAEDWMAMAQATYQQDSDGLIRASYDPRITDPFKKGATNPQSEALMWAAFDGLKDIPTLALRGELSDLFSVETLAEMGSRKPDLHTYTCPGVGHVPLPEDPGVFDAVSTFLAQIDAVEAAGASAG